jgi:hypothetical protein
VAGLEAGGVVDGELGAGVAAGVVGALVAPVVGAAAADDGLAEPGDDEPVARGPAASRCPDLPTP